MPDYQNVNVKLYRETPEDSELIKFLEDKPTTWIVKQALHLYKRQYESAMKTEPTQAKETPQEKPEQPKVNGTLSRVRNMTGGAK